MKKMIMVLIEAVASASRELRDTETTANACAMI